MHLTPKFIGMIETFYSDGTGNSQYPSELYSDGAGFTWATSGNILTMVWDNGWPDVVQ